MKKKKPPVNRFRPIKGLKVSSLGKDTAKAIEKKLAEIKKENEGPGPVHTHLSLFRRVQ